jgi:hypothetical protein
MDRSMTADERKALRSLSKNARSSGIKPGLRKVASLKSGKSDAKGLKENVAWFASRKR